MVHKYDSPYEQARLALIESALPEGRGIGVDVGCGPGNTTHLLKRRGWQSIAVDLHPGGNTIADVRALPFRSGSVHLVTCLEVIEHLSNHDQVLAELARILGIGGSLVLSTPNRLSLQAACGSVLYRMQGRQWDYGDATHISVRTAYTVRQELRRNGFSITRTLGLQFLPHRPPLFAKWAYGSSAGFAAYLAYNVVFIATRSAERVWN